MTTCTLKDVARASWSQDSFARNIKLPVVEAVLDVALRQVVGLNATLGRGPITIDLGNGYELVCEARKNGKPRPMGMRD